MDPTLLLNELPNISLFTSMDEMTLFQLIGSDVVNTLVINFCNDLFLLISDVVYYSMLHNTLCLHNTLQNIPIEICDIQTSSHVIGCLLIDNWLWRINVYKLNYEQGSTITQKTLCYNNESTSYI